MEKIKMTYADSMRRLDEILEDMDESRVSIDDLAEQVVEAAGLLKHCRGLLTRTEAKVREVLDDLEQEFSEDKDED
jgi:exodeoxyribonuclease VII small subunit